MPQQYTTLTDKLQFVRDQCRGIAGAKHHKNYTMIRCPFHDDLNPSGSIYHSETTKNPGFFRCYGCGKTASWDELAPLIGCEPFSNNPRVRYAETRNFQIDRELEDTPEKLILSELPNHKLWRGVSTNLLKKIGCKVCRIKYADGNLSKDRFLYLPVIIDGETVGYTKGRMHKVEGETSYINLRGSWVKTHGLFPFDYAIRMMTHTKTVVLVEGQRDALRLLANGVPAMCIMGTQSFSESKCRLLAMHGVNRCVILMDGDDAGKEGTRKVYPILSEFLECKVLKLWAMKGSPYVKYKTSSEAKEAGIDLWDPGNCPQWIIDRIKERYIL